MSSMVDERLADTPASVFILEAERIAGNLQLLACGPKAKGQVQLLFG